MSDNPNNLSPPTIDLLCRELRDIVEWERLAISLKVPYVEVTSIQREYHDVQRCKLHALQQWLQQTNNVHSWRTVASAVNDVNPAVAECIKQKYAPVLDEVPNHLTLLNQRRGNNCMARINAKILLIISLLLVILVGITACLIVLIILLRASDSALTYSMTTTGVPMYTSASSMSSIFPLSYTNTMAISSTLVTSSMITSSLSPTPSPRPGNAN